MNATEPAVNPRVTIVVVPRERFSCAAESLDSIYQHTTMPFKLVYVDGGSPARTQRYLEAQSRERGFHLLRTDSYLSPNRARNLGLREVKTSYLVFIDNDVIVSPRWLETLIECAEETGAAVVGPLTCQHKPVHEKVHCAGGESGVEIKYENGQETRHIIEKIYSQGRSVSGLRPQLKREQTGLAEFHCMLVQASIFDETGPLDEQLLNTKEHVDFCMLVDQAGGTVWFEPESVVTYVPGPPRDLADLSFYMLRWSNEWELASLKRLRDKWNLTEDKYFRHRYRNVGWRRKMTIVRPLSEKLTFGRGSRRLEGVLSALDQRLNRRLTDRYSRYGTQ
ncbi:MAG: glycosyltransferase family 2 protein [Gammaproteobacteria bacterium]|nr:glycosyltransferase family 2 protein [Gammaproteobacteria bacterium]